MFNVNIQEIMRINGEVSLQMLPQISFDIKSGCIYTITGKNGSGKTTLLKSLTSLLDKRFYKITGKILFRGKDILNLDDSELNQLRRKEIKYVLQDSISSFNPLKKLEYYFKLFNPERHKFNTLLRDFALPSIESLDQMHSYELSGGMAQRLSLALALSVNPLLLLLDEPNSAIDPEMSNVFSDTLKKFVRDSESAVLMTTQDLDFAEATSDYIGYLNKDFSGFISKQDFFSGSFSDPDFSKFISAYRYL